MDTPIEIAALGHLTKLGEGGEGVVFRCDDREGIAFKRYLRPTPDIGGTLMALDDRLGLLPPTHATYVRDRTALPTRLVTENGVVVGFVMRAVPPEFYATSHDGTRFLMELQHLIYAGSPRVQRLTLPEVTRALRVELLRQWTQVVATLNSVGVAVGDISERNLLWTLDPEPRVMFLDCDGMRIEGRADQREVIQAPDFRDPDVGEAFSWASDSYKLALVILRVLTGDFRSDLRARVPSDVAGDVDADRLTDLVKLVGDPERRPSALEWLRALGGQWTGPHDDQRAVRAALLHGAWDRALALAAMSPVAAPRAGLARALTHLAVEQPVEVLLAEVREASLLLRLRWPEADVMDELHVRITSPQATASFTSLRSTEPIIDVVVPFHATEVDMAHVSVSASSSLLRSVLGHLPEVCWRPVALN